LLKQIPRMTLQLSQQYNVTGLYMHIFLVIILILFSFSANAAAWLKKTGESQIIHQFSYYSTDEAFNSNGDRNSIDDFSKSEYQIFYEQGWGPDVTIGATARLQKLVQDISSGGEDRNIGIPELEVFARLPLYRSGNQVLSIQPLVRIPNPEADRNTPRLGNRNPDVEARLLYGRNFDNQAKLFGNFEVAYRYRSGTSSDEIRLDPSLGYNYTDKILLLGQVFSTWSAGNGSNKLLALTNSEDYDLVKLQASGVYKVNNGLSLQVGAFSNIYGENTGAGSGVLFGIWQDF
jgi:protein XagA